jgi:uncharacterized protein (DUF1330 family)
MTAYVIADARVTKPEPFQAYRRLCSLAVNAYDAKMLVHGGKTKRLEGRDPGEVVVMEFPSMAAAQAFYDSWQYRRARNLRAGAAEMNLIIVEGV